MTNKTKLSGDGKPFDDRWTGDAGVLYDPPQWQNASDIGLAGFRQILLWPLVLRLPLETRSREDAVRDAVDATARRLTADSANWEVIEDLFDHPLKPVDPAERDERSFNYGEFVYFHDYIQSVLYRSGKQTREIQLFRRKGVETFSTVINGVLFEADVARCNLYLLATGMAVLAVEFDFGQQPSVMDKVSKVSRRMTLSDAQNFIDQARRTYAPYFDGDAGQPGGTPSLVDWFDGAGNRLDVRQGWKRPVLPSFPQSCFPSKQEMFEPPSGQDDSKRFRLRDDDRTGRRSAPVAEAWRAILQPLIMTGYEEEDGLPKGHAAWRHVVDERIPCLSFVSLSGSGATAPATPGVDDPKKDWPRKVQQQRNDMATVSRGDWIRLCFADSPGGPYPYAPEFFRGFEAKHCYDRFWPSQAHDSATRFMFAGYHTCAVGAGDYFDKTLVHHVRRHYFQMTLLTQIEFASLLAISSRVTEAVTDYRKNRLPGKKEAILAQETFQHTMQSIQRDFLEFVHLFRFTGLSNQIQAQELFAKMREALGLDELFKDVKAELEAATSYVLAVDQQKQAQASNHLSLIAVIGFVFSLVLAAAGANLFLDGKTVELMTQVESPPPKPEIFVLKKECDAVEVCKPPTDTDSKVEPKAKGLEVFQSRYYGLHLSLFGIILFVCSLFGWVASRTLLGQTYAAGARTAAKVLGWSSAAGLSFIGAGLLFLNEYAALGQAALLIVSIAVFLACSWAWLNDRYASR